MGIGLLVAAAFAGAAAVVVLRLLPPREPGAAPVTGPEPGVGPPADADREPLEPQPQT
jgi:hypothetical protein